MTLKTEKRPMACSCCYYDYFEADGVKYKIMPHVSLDDFASRIQEPLGRALKRANQDKVAIPEVEMRHEDIFTAPAIDITGKLILSDDIFDGLGSEGIEEQISGMVSHEKAHLKYTKSEDFAKLWEEAKRCGVIDWFREGQFLRSRGLAYKMAGHPEDSPSELYASAYTIADLHLGQFNTRFYNSADAQQRAVVDRVFSFVDGNGTKNINLVISNKR